jgi:hypothetical protein
MIAQEYKAERDQIREKHDAVQMKLAERNASIEKIEQEVHRVQQQFQAKHETLVLSHNQEMQALISQYQVYILY